MKAYLIVDGVTRRVMTLREQLGHWDAHWYESMRYMQELWECDPWRFVDPSRERTEAGYLTYGDRSWWKDEDELDQDIIEEGADGISYGVMQRWRDGRQPER